MRIEIIIGIFECLCDCCAESFDLTAVGWRPLRIHALDDGGVALGHGATPVEC